MLVNNYKQLERPVCKYCGVVFEGLRPAPPNLVCQAPQCQAKFRAALLEQHRNEQALQHTRRQQHLNKVLNEYHALDQDGEPRSASGDPTIANAVSKPHFSVPANLRPLVELPTERKEQFLAHLQRVTEAAFQLDAPPANQTTATVPISDEAAIAATRASRLVSAACGTCQGYCCRHGQNHAFYSEEHIQRLRQQNPQLTASQTIDLVASYLPMLSVQDACVMQGPQGCELPREYRANLCNKFECSELVDLLKGVDREPVVIVAIDGNALVRQSQYAPQS